MKNGRQARGALRGSGPNNIFASLISVHRSHDLCRPIVICKMSSGIFCLNPRHPAVARERTDWWLEARVNI